MVGQGRTLVLVSVPSHGLLCGRCLHQGRVIIGLHGLVARAWALGNWTSKPGLFLSVFLAMLIKLPLRQRNWDLPCKIAKY